MADVNRLIKQYEKIYGETIDVSDWTIQKVSEILEWCDKQKQLILLESHFNSYMQNPDYTKVIILESLARHVLIEIAPKRIRKKGKKKHE